MFQFGTEDVNGSFRLVLLRNVCCGGNSRVEMLLPQFVKQVCPSANDADAVAVSGILLKECPANA